MAAKTPTDFLNLANQANRGNFHSIADAIRALAVGEPYQSGAGSPVGTVTPRAIGEKYFDTTGLVFYTANALTSSDWIAAGSIVRSATVAAAGTAQGNATAVSYGFTLVTAADDSASIKLPAAAPGRVCIIKNNESENKALSVFPSTGDGINAIAVNGNLSMAAKTSAHFVAYDATTWFTVPRVPS